MMQWSQFFRVEAIKSTFLQKGEFLLYKIAIYATINLIDDAAMIAMIFT